MYSDSIEICPELKLHYYRWGNGPQVLLAFHGYGLEGSSFFPLQALHQHFTVYSIDLPYHGKSVWTKTKALPLSLWKRFIETLKKRHSIVRYSMMGFSMGGKFALCTLDFDAASIDELYLIAPDGIRKNKFYSIATRNALSRYVFKRITHHPNAFLALANWAEKWKLVSIPAVKFSKTQMATPVQRQMAYKTWVAFRLFYGPLSSRIKSIHQHRVLVTLITGKFDKVIREEDVSPLSVLPPGIFTWIRLECGHTGILKKLESCWEPFSPKSPFGGR